jgi:triosephosphate isomerase
VRKKIIAGNWKMHKTRGEARELTEAIVGAIKGEKDLPVVVLIPPFTSLETVMSTVKGSVVEVGAQNMEYRDSGAYTGEVAPSMITDLGVKYILIGHSERRLYFGETNATVNLKLKAAIKHKLKPIVCVGESLDEREAGLTDAVIRRQVASALAELTPKDFSDLAIAYEPLWAIGTGKVCEAAEANRVSSMIRGTIRDLYNTGDSGKSGAELADSIPILYGGSVKPSNVEAQLAQPEVDGALVGGASLTAAEFLPLLKAAQKQVKLAVSKV